MPPQPSAERARVLGSLAQYLLIVDRFAEAQGAGRGGRRHRRTSRRPGRGGQRPHRAGRRPRLPRRAGRGAGRAGGGGSPRHGGRRPDRPAAGGPQPLGRVAGDRPPYGSGDGRPRWHPAGPPPRPGPLLRAAAGPHRHRGAGRPGPLGPGRAALPRGPGDRPVRSCLRRLAAGPGRPRAGPWRPGRRPGAAAGRAAPASGSIPEAQTPVRCSVGWPNWRCGAATSTRPGSW